VTTRRDLVALCRRGPLAGLDPALTERLADPALRAELWRLASRHRVYGLVHVVAADLLAPRQDPDVTETLRHLRRSSAVLQLSRDDLVRCLRASGIEPVVLKGAAVMDTLYREPVERDLDDLDILVSEPDVARAATALAEAGYAADPALPSPEAYRRHHFHLPLQHRGRPMVEVHWALSRPFSPFQLPAERVLAGAVVAPHPADLAMRVPRPEHLILHIVLQNLQESFSRLSRVVDLDRIATSCPGLDWDLLTREARDGDLGPAASLSLQLAKRVFGSPIPEAVIRDLRPSRLARFHLAILEPVASLLSQRLSNSSAMHVHTLWLVARASQRASLLRRLLLADDEFVDIERHEVSPARGALKLVKLVAFQAAAYASAAARSLTVTGRAQMRFWSSQARSSDLL
jgi:putative nucleotidyltransferase-like protein